MSGKERRQRLPQQERSRTTRNRILDATLDCLIEQGYAATSTPEVCRRAGVSRGALLHHFPTREQLVVSAVSHLAERRAREIRAQLEAPHRPSPHRGKRDARRAAASASGARGSGEEGLAAVLSVMWSAFTGPLFHAALELWVAARSDPALHQALYPVERATGRGMQGLWSELFPSARETSAERRQRRQDLVALTQHLLRGMAVQRLLAPEDASRARLFDLWKHMAQRELESGSPATPRKRD